MKHEWIERNGSILTLLIILFSSIGGIVQIIPLFYLEKEGAAVSAGIRPYTPLELEGRDIYIREGCFTCHSQMIRTLLEDYKRYGHHSISEESIYDFPFQWGSKRTGPDLARIGGVYTDFWHELHLKDPSSLISPSVMPGYPWLLERTLDSSKTKRKISIMKDLGVPYKEDIDLRELKGKTEMDALIAYLQVLGTMVNFKKIE